MDRTETLAELEKKYPVEAKGLRLFWLGNKEMRRGYSFEKYLLERLIAWDRVMTKMPGVVCGFKNGRRPKRKNNEGAT